MYVYNFSVVWTPYLIIEL